MYNEFLHVFRNTPFGREILLQSLCFCKKTKTFLKLYIPRYHQFLMYFNNKVITVQLDKSFLHSPDTAKKHAEDVIKAEGVEPKFIELMPEDYTASIPNLPVDFTYMCCPRSISDLSTKIRLGYIGTTVRSIIKNSGFPVLIPSPVYKKWKSVTVFFGGSKNSCNVLRLGVKISLLSGLPLKIFTQTEKHNKEYYRKSIEGKLDEYKKRLNDIGDSIEIDKNNMLKTLKFEWLCFDKGEFYENLYSVAHDTLVVVGSYGHSVVKDILFGSKMEQIQATLPNNLLIVGPKYNSKIL